MTRARRTTGTMHAKPTAREITLAALGEIVGTVSRVDRQSKRDEYTDLDAVWGALYEVRNAARRAIRATLKEAKSAPKFCVFCIGNGATKSGPCAECNGTGVNQETTTNTDTEAQS